MFVRKLQEFRIKVGLIGDDNSGKSSIMHRYIKDKYPLPANTIASTYSGKIVEKDGNKVTFQLLDTAGNPRLKDMVITSIINYDFVIVCFDLNDPDGFSTTKEWVSSIREKTETTIVLCGTKYDMLSTNTIAIRNSIIAFYSDGLQLTYFETSSKTGENIAEMFDYIATEHIRNIKNSAAIKIEDLQKTESNTELKGGRCNTIMRKVTFGYCKVQ